MRGRLAVVVPLLLLAACAGTADLAGPERHPPGDESAALRRKADEATKQARYADAWNLEAQAGTDRARLEAIAIAALEADKGPYEDMLKSLRTKFGPLTAGARSRVDALVKAREGEGKWTDATDVAIVAADDPPQFKGAWAVYDLTPVKDALDVYQLIEKARKAFEEDARKPAK